jgi:EmrB/QacA subfamily drug resistance transporter
MLQGVFGAALVPLSQSVLLDINPREKHGSAMAVWGMGVMIGPILGPTLGGWLTDSYSWRWVFFINLPIGAMAFYGIWRYIHPTAPARRVRFDTFGFVTLSIAIGALQMLLDRGEQNDWFASTETWVELMLTGAEPSPTSSATPLTRPAGQSFVDFRLLKNANYVTGLLLIFIVGMVLFATRALMPTMLQGLMGYPAALAGLVTAPSGLGTMAAMLVVGKLTGKVDFRLLLGVGFAITAFSLWQMTQYTLVLSQSDIVWPGVIQGVGLGLVFVPLSAATFATLSPQMRAEGTALYSLVRNIGSSIGIALVQALLVRNTQIAHASLPTQVTSQSGAERSVQRLQHGHPGRRRDDQQRDHAPGLDDRLRRRLLADDAADRGRDPAAAADPSAAKASGPAPVDHAPSINLESLEKCDTHSSEKFHRRRRAGRCWPAASACRPTPASPQPRPRRARPARARHHPAGRRLARRAMVAGLWRPAAERPGQARALKDNPSLAVVQARVAGAQRRVGAERADRRRPGRPGDGPEPPALFRQRLLPAADRRQLLQRRQRAAARFLRRRLVGQAPLAGGRRAGRTERAPGRSGAGRAGNRRQRRAELLPPADAVGAPGQRGALAAVQRELVAGRKAAHRARPGQRRRAARRRSWTWRARTAARSTPGRARTRSAARADRRRRQALADLARFKPAPARNALPRELGMELLARRPDLQAARWRVEAQLGRVAASEGRLPSRHQPGRRASAWTPSRSASCCAGRAARRCSAPRSTCRCSTAAA